jgi:hypothetical protein
MGSVSPFCHVTLQWPMALFIQAPLTAFASGNLIQEKAICCAIKNVHIRPAFMGFSYLLSNSVAVARPYLLEAVFRDSFR